MAMEVTQVLAEFRDRHGERFEITARQWQEVTFVNESNRRFRSELENNESELQKLHDEVNELQRRTGVQSVRHDAAAFNKLMAAWNKILQLMAKSSFVNNRLTRHFRKQQAIDQLPAVIRRKFCEHENVRLQGGFDKHGKPTNVKIRRDISGLL